MPEPDRTLGPVDESIIPRSEWMPMPETNPPATAQAVHIRWMIRGDMPRVLEIERASFDEPWPEDEFLRVLRQTKVIGMIAHAIGDDRQRPLAFMVYELGERVKRDPIRVLDFAVHPDHRRRGIGSAMIDKLVGKLGGRRTRLEFIVPEDNLPFQVFLRENEVKAVEVLRRHFGDGRDAYRMTYTLAGARKEAARG